MRRGMSWGLAVLLAGALPAVAVAQESPDLPVAEWSRGASVALEDFRGQVTALIFYDDNES